DEVGTRRSGSAAAVTRSRVRTGLEVLLEERRELLSGRTYGLICHQASVDADLGHAVDLLRAAGAGRLAALFGPEHGISGEAQDMITVGGATDTRTGLPV